MNIFSVDFVSAFKEMLKKALQSALQEMLNEMKDDEQFLMNREEISKVIGVDTTTFDKCYRQLPGFPYHMKGTQEVWNKREVFEYLHQNKLIK